MATGAELKRIRMASGLSANKLAALAGVSVERLRKWEQNDHDPREGDEALLLKFFDVPTLEALKEVKEVPESSKNISAQRIVRAPNIRPKTGTSSVPFYEADFAAGTGIQFYEDNIEQPAYTMDIPGFSGCVAFTSYGDSMEKLIRRGSILFGRKLDDWQSFIEFGQVYGIVMKDGRRFLKYIRRANDARRFRLESENDQYDSFEVPQSKIHNIWLIEGWLLKTA